MKLTPTETGFLITVAIAFGIKIILAMYKYYKINEK